MNKPRLLSAAALLLIGTASAFAQTADKPNPAPAPPAQQNALPEKIAPPMNAGQSMPGDAVKSETTGQKPTPGPNASDIKDMNPSTDKKAGADVPLGTTQSK